MDDLTPLDARNSLLLERDQKDKNSMFTITSTGHEKDPAMVRADSPDRYASTVENGSMLPGHARSGSNGSYNQAGHLRVGSGGQSYRPLTPVGAYDAERSLMGNAAPPGVSRQPTLPMNGGYGYGRSTPSPAPYGAAYRYPPNGGNGNYGY